MTRMLLAILPVFLLVTGDAHGRDKPDKALCPVCAVRGETELEKVKSEVEYDGSWYYFCSDHCGEEFETDPIAYIPARLPRPAPEFLVETLDGADAKSEFTGNVTLVDFWATWCKPCVKIMPEIQRLSDKYSGKGFRVMGISIDDQDDRIERIMKFVEKHDIDYPVYSDAKDTPAWFKYRVKAVPAMFLVDRDGQVVAEWKGTVDHDALAREVARLVDPSQ